MMMKRNPIKIQYNNHKEKNKVELAVSVLGGNSFAAAYHTSVVINGTEYFFDMSGIMSTNNFGSHQNKQQFSTFEIGYTNKTASQMLDKLRQYFLSGTYDLIRKNCNSFSDCALYYLVKKRLDPQYNRLEKLGASMMGSMMQNSEYKPNPKADDFDKEKIIENLEDKLVFKKTDGLSLGGGKNADTVDEVRQKRLMAMEKMMNK